MPLPPSRREQSLGWKSCVAEATHGAAGFGTVEASFWAGAVTTASPVLTGLCSPLLRVEAVSRVGRRALPLRVGAGIPPKSQGLQDQPLGAVDCLALQHEARWSRGV